MYFTNTLGIHCLYQSSTTWKMDLPSINNVIVSFLFTMMWPDDLPRNQFWKCPWPCHILCTCRRYLGRHIGSPSTVLSQVLHMMLQANTGRLDNVYINSLQGHVNTQAYSAWQPKIVIYIWVDYLPLIVWLWQKHLTDSLNGFIF